MARASWLPTVLRNAGLTVHLQPGWDTRGANTFNPQGIIVHATAGKLDVATDIRVLLQGSATAPPPIAQLFLARNGDWHVIASGRCNHALTGWGGLLKGLGNTNLIGIEAANDNRNEPWPTVQYESYVRGVAAICRHLGWSTNRIAGHKEHQPPAAGRSSIKSDPTFDMGAFRNRVAAVLAGRTESAPAPTAEGDDMTPEQANTLERIALTLGWLIQGKERTGPQPGLPSDMLFDIVPNRVLRQLIEKPAGTVTLTAEDRTAIVAELRLVVREEIAARFADAGQVDDPASAG